MSNKRVHYHGAHQTVHTNGGFAGWGVKGRKRGGGGMTVSPVDPSEPWPVITEAEAAKRFPKTMRKLKNEK